MLCSLLLSSAASVARDASLPAHLDNTRRWHFEVLLDGKPIGEHEFAITQRAQGVEVWTRAHFRVKAFFVPLYAYDHQDHEIWRGGCLAQIDAETSDNGRKFTVHGHLAGPSFEVRGPQGAATLPACVKSFAYWDMSELGEHRLLNAQSGEYEPVELSRHGIDSLLTQGHRVEAEHYSLTARKFSIDLWYSHSGEWLALESHTGQGRTLRYELR